MMNLLEQVRADIRAALFSTDNGIAVNVTYEPSDGGPATEIQALIEYGEDLDDARWSTVLQASAALWIDQVDVPFPEVGDLVTIDGRQWRVERMTTMAAGFIRVEIRRDLRPKFGQGR